MEPVCKSEPLDVPSKKSQFQELYSAYMYNVDPYFRIQAAALDQYMNFSAFRPWPNNKRPFLSREPPILQHPEKVVKLKDTSRFERTFQPNVALKPHHPPTPPSSDEITSSTSPPPTTTPTSTVCVSPLNSSHHYTATPPDLRPPPPECELSTDTDEDDVKDNAIHTHLHTQHSYDKDQQSHIKKSIISKEKEFKSRRECHKANDLLVTVKSKDSTNDKCRLLEEEVNKHRDLVSRQAEKIKELDMTLFKQIDLLKEKDLLITKQDNILKEKDIIIARLEEVLKRKEECILQQSEALKQYQRVRTKNGMCLVDSETRTNDRDIVVVKSEVEEEEEEEPEEKEVKGEIIKDERE